MKDPCKECLVQVCCTEVCWDKENYKTLLKNKQKNFLFAPTKLSPANARELRHTQNELWKTRKGITKIRDRKQSIN